MPEDYPQIAPYLYYEDAAAAIDWLVKAFGLTERMRMDNDDGTVAHAELQAGGGVIMLGQPASFESPKKRGGATSGVHA